MPRTLGALALFVAAALLLLSLPVGARDNTLPAPKTQPPATSARAMALYEPESGIFLAEKNADERLPMASTTKIMTALVALETLPLDGVISVPPEAVGVEGSSIYLYMGEKVTVRTLLYALLLSSANDAAAALAVTAGGSIGDFADMMNAKAAAIGLSDTHFSNPHGLHDEEHYTTARDLARLAAVALENKIFAEIVSTRRYTAPQEGTAATRLFLNHNRLLRTYEGAVGVKTGYTKAAGRCLVGAAERGGLTLVAVTLADPNDWRDHAALFDWGFSEYVGFCPSPAPVSVPVVGGTAGEVQLLPEGSLRLTLPADHAEITASVEAPRFLFGGFDAGEVKGKVVYRVNGAKIGEIPLVTAKGVAAERPLGFFARLKQRFQK